MSVQRQQQGVLEHRGLVIEVGGQIKLTFHGNNVHTALKEGQ